MKQSLFLGLTALSGLVLALQKELHSHDQKQVEKGFGRPRQLDEVDPIEGDPEMRHHRHHHRRRRHHSRHHSCHEHEDHEPCGCDRRPRPESCPCDLSVCTTKIGNFTMITRPVGWSQAPNACAMLGLKLAEINIENFMDATKMAFQCSGAFSQSFIRSWNGDAYKGVPLVLSTGSAAPGGSINEVFDGELPRNVLCEVSCGPVVKPDCHDSGHVDCGCHQDHHPGRRDCGCNRRLPTIGCDHNRFIGKMKCLRCFCRRSAQCPLLGGGGNQNPGFERPGFGGRPLPTGVNIPVNPGINPLPTGVNIPGNPGVVPSVTPTNGRPRPTRTVTSILKKDAVATVAVQGQSRFFADNQKQVKIQTGRVKGSKKPKDDGDDDEDQGEDGDDDQGDDNEEEEDDGRDDQDDDFFDEEMFELDESGIAKMSPKGLKGIPFYPETCGSECVCYACSEFDDHHHHRRRHHDCGCGNDQEGGLFGMDDEESKKKGTKHDKAQLQQTEKALRQVVSFNTLGVEVKNEDKIEQVYIEPIPEGMIETE